MPAFDRGQTTPPAVAFSSIALFANTSVGVTKVDGRALLWGHDGNGMYIPGVESFSHLALGTSGVCGINESKSMKCWGGGDTFSKSVPSGRFIDVSVSRDFGCAIKEEGSIVCWGRNYGNFLKAPTSGRYFQLAGGEYHTCAIELNGNVACWGYGQFGDPVNSAEYIYNQSNAPDGTFTSISAGYYHTCGILADGSVKCWGYNDQGQSAPPAGTFTEVAAGLSHSCGIDTNAQIKCWGSNTNGRSTPPQVKL
jgi:alpha-tubulin suppressor-like RCC1 family protein